jgi:hypothetical protein
MKQERAQKHVMPTKALPVPIKHSVSQPLEKHTDGGRRSSNYARR